MNKTKHKIRLLNKLLQDKHAPVLESLGDPVSRQEIEKLFHANNVFFNESLICLLEWHNGTHDIYYVKDSVIEILPFFKFFNIEEIIRKTHLFRKWAYLNKFDINLYTPFMGSGEDDLLLIKKDTQAVFFMSSSANIYLVPYFHSIENLLDFIISCYEREILKIDIQQGIIVDWEKYLFVPEMGLNNL